MLANLVTMAASGTFRRYRARQDVLRGLHAALGDSTKWRPADDLPDRVLFTDPAIYSRWLGVPVMIDDGHFDCTMEWGTRVRGVYELECPPELIVMRWDLEDDNVSIPGGEMTGYLRVEARDSGAHVEVHQLVDTPRQADFMEAAWGLVLGRLKKGVLAASNPAVLIRPRARRAKRRPSA